MTNVKKSDIIERCAMCRRHVLDQQAIRFKGRLYCCTECAESDQCVDLLPKAGSSR